MIQSGGIEETPLGTQRNGFGNFFSSLFTRSSNVNEQEVHEPYTNGHADDGETSFHDVSYDQGEEPEVPLLEDLDIDVDMIKNNLKSVIFFKKFEHRFTEDPDMGGPMIVGFSLALALMLSAKITFGYIYGLITCGGLFIYCIINLVLKNNYYMLYGTISVLGYSLFPLVILSLISAVIKLSSGLGVLLGILFALWSTYTAIRFLNSALNLDNQKYLIGYPIFLFYITFVMIIIF